MKRSIRLLLLLLVVLLAANGCTFFDARTNRVPDSRDVDEQTVEALLSIEQKECVNAEVFRVFSYPYRGFDAPQERLFAEYSSLEELLAEQCDTVYLVIYQTEEVYPENFPRGGETYISTMPYEHVKTEDGFREASSDECVWSSWSLVNFLKEKEQFFNGNGFVEKTLNCSIRKAYFIANCDLGGPGIGRIYYGLGPPFGLDFAIYLVTDKGDFVYLAFGLPGRHLRPEVNPGYEADEDSRYFVENGLLVPAEDLIKYQKLLESLPEERRGEYVWDVVQYDVDSPYLPWLLRYPILRPSVATKQQRIVRSVVTGVVVVTLAVGCIVLIRRRKKKKAAVCPAELPPQPTEPRVEQ